MKKRKKERQEKKKMRERGREEKKKGFWSKARMFVNHFSSPITQNKYCLVTREDKEDKIYAYFKFQALSYKNKVVDYKDKLVQKSLDFGVNMMDNVANY